MKLILFYHNDCAATLGGRFKDAITRSWTDIETEICQTIYSLKGRMAHRPDFFKYEVYILLVDSKSRLMELALLNNLTEDKNLILILPDDSKETMRLAMYLYPRFVTGISDDYEDLHQVLEQMSGKRRHK